MGTSGPDYALGSAFIGRAVADSDTATERRDRIHAILRDAMARLDDIPLPTQDQLEGQVRGYLAWLRGQGVI